MDVGCLAPEFSGRTYTGENIRLSDFTGKHPVVLYFYPKDNTRVCTKEACMFRDNYSALREAGAVVIGVSKDSEHSHQQFAKEHQLPFYLLSDKDGHLHHTYGVSKTFGLLPARVTFVIGQDGLIKNKISSLLSAEKHVDEALKTVQSLK